MTKEIKRAKNWATKKIEFDMYLDGRYVGSAETKKEAEERLDDMAYEAARHELQVAA